MTMLLQNRTISMILTVPEVKQLVSPASHSVENLDQKTLSLFKNSKPPSIPIYHGSIIRIEQHRDNQNTSDLIVRVPNFHHSSLPSVTISTNGIDSQREASFKRRAPICPIFHDHSPSSNRNRTNDLDNSNVHQSETNARLTNTKRLATGLRNLSQAFTTNCKSKRSTNINEITLIPVLPDVEVIRQDLEVPTLSKKTTKNQNLTSKFLTPKILFIKRKCFKIKREQSSTSDSVDIQTDIEDNTMENSRTSINLKDNKVESKQTTPAELNHEVVQQSTTIAQLIPKIPILLIDSESSSTHRYCTISGFPSDSRPTMTKNDTLISKENNVLSTDRQSLVSSSDQQTQHYDTDIEDTLYVVHPNGDTYSECYEVTYEFNPEFQHLLDTKTDQFYFPENESITNYYLTEMPFYSLDQSSIKYNVDPFEYQDLTSALTTWLPIFPNNYEQVQTNSIDQISHRTTDLEDLQTNSLANRPRVKFHSLEDFSEISDDQTTTYHPESISILSSSHDNDQLLCLNEDYTVIIQLLKHVLQIDANTNDADNEFNQQLDEIFQIN